ncbi:uncharacterized protein LOC110596068 [Carlito syrichta]|uniref:Uncharacterized protein LOC110596068 n=1 Tax=Carlito syrichta TaxID=1868482 RepID=A0A3Q0E8Q9_CARSF|nr:uncharacterized protein LOC110596068 [Carlito syrichta]
MGGFKTGFMLQGQFLGGDVTGPEELASWSMSQVWVGQGHQSAKSEKISNTIFKFYYRETSHRASPMTINQLLTPSAIKELTNILWSFFHVSTDGSTSVFQLGLEKNWQVNTTCVVECPVNCQLSDWSSWSECSPVRGLTGSPVWKGTRTRNISCVVSDGSVDDFSKVVDEEFCANIEPMIDANKNMILEETCALPCPESCYRICFKKTRRKLKMRRL